MVNWLNVLVQIALAGVIAWLGYGIRNWMRAINALLAAQQANQRTLDMAIDKLDGVDRRLKLVEQNSEAPRNSRGRPF